MSDSFSGDSPADDRGIEARWTFWAAVGVGTLLRTVGLLSQVLVGDEMHAFRAALRMRLGEALIAYPATANSPPFNAWLRLLLDLGITPTELAVRAPVWLAGIALLVLAPWWIGRRLGPGVGVVTAWLVAISPPLVYYSRFMRPYAPFVLLTALATALAFDWAHRPRRATGVALAVVSVAAAYVHLLAAPVVAAVFVWLLAERFIRPAASTPAPSLRQVVALAGLTAGLMAVFVVPAWSNLLELASARRVPVEATLGDVAAALTILSGSRAIVATVALWGLAVAGAIRLARRSPALARLAGLVIVVHAIGVPALSPSFIGGPQILARYLAPLLVPVLVLVAVALEPRGGARWRIGLGSATVGMIATLFATGPLTSPALYESSLAWTPEVLNVHRSVPHPVRPVPKLYGVLARLGGSVVELPARAVPRFVALLGDYQRAHGLEVRISPGDRYLSDPRLGLDSIVADDPPALLDSGARWVVLHRDWRKELGPSLGYLGPVSDKAMRRARQILRLLKRAARIRYRILVKAWGQPTFENDLLAIWDLETLR